MGPNQGPIFWVSMNRFRLPLSSVFALFAVSVLALKVPRAACWGPILMLGGLIFLHEGGHFLAAKGMGMPVEVFSLGFGPRLLGFKWRETDVRLSLLPLGGYVKLAGFNPEEPGAEDPYGFLQQSFSKRMLFYSGGILANLVTTLVLFTYVGADQARIIKAEPRTGAAPVVDQVVKGQPADLAGLRPGAVASTWSVEVRPSPSRSRPRPRVAPAASASRPAPSPTISNVAPSAQ